MEKLLKLYNYNFIYIYTDIGTILFTFHDQIKNKNKNIIASCKEDLEE